MGFAELLLIAVGLSMDAFAVSICKGLSLKKLKLRHAVLVGLYFGGFQFLMPVIGWALGYRFEHIIESVDHWVAFGLLTIIGVCASGSVVLIVLILVLILAWNYIKLLFEAAERYVLLGVLVFTAPVAFAMGASQSTSSIFKSWCRMFGGQVFLLLMNAWCLRLFTSMVGAFISNPLSI